METSSFTEASQRDHRISDLSDWGLNFSSNIISRNSKDFDQIVSSYRLKSGTRGSISFSQKKDIFDRLNAEESQPDETVKLNFLNI